MGSLTQAFSHLDLETVKQKVRMTFKRWGRQTRLVIDNLMTSPRPVAEMALHIGVSKGYNDLEFAASATLTALEIQLEYEPRRGFCVRNTELYQLFKAISVA